MHKVLTKCRLCDGPFYENSLRLHDTPPANELYPDKESALKAERFPLDVVMCTECKHLQLRDIVDPVRLFGDYVYKSGTSVLFRNHFTELAEKLRSKIKESAFVVEVGSNDGTLLHALNSQGFKTLGIEPSVLLVRECLNENLLVLEGYLDDSIVKKIIKKYGEADCLIGNNVFAHIDDMNSAFRNVFYLLANNGLFIFEVAHALNILKDNLFDTIYHEHMSYHTVASMIPFSEKLGFTLEKVEKISTHGGSLRFFLRKGKNLFQDSSVQKILEEEVSSGLTNPELLNKIREAIDLLKNQSLVLIHSVTRLPKRFIFGYGAPAKAVTFLAEVGLEEITLIGVIDDNPSKQNKFLPGSGHQIVSSSEMQSIVAGYKDGETFSCLIFPWNLSVEILGKLKDWLPKNSSVISFFPTPKEIEF